MSWCGCDCVWMAVRGSIDAYWVAAACRPGMSWLTGAALYVDGCGLCVCAAHLLRRQLSTLTAAAG
jgi:hypothetical protein